ncbi:hypothetical protein ABZ319_35570 [Nocardia sp. NPDC005978]|uniref:hypothetical protein n=1 Tax=Nocardia sp. NPDC005978 TaxID=3156725 RepID=UPI0033A02DD7
MKMRTFAAAAAMSAAALGVIAGPGAAPASANSMHGCNYPYVCFYLTGYDSGAQHPTAMYQDRGYWQTLGPNSRGSIQVVNTRNDDGALLKFADGSTQCVKPNYGTLLYKTVTQIKITDSPSCK